MALPKPGEFVSIDPKDLAELKPIQWSGTETIFDMAAKTKRMIEDSIHLASRPPLTIMSRLHEADEPGKIEGLLNIPHLDIPMTYEPKMPAWGLTPPQMVILPPDRPDLVEDYKNLINWTDQDDVTSWDVLHQAGELVIGIDTAGPGGDGVCSAVFERQSDGSLRVIDFFTSTPWDRRRQKRLDRGIKLKAPPSRGWARHIRKQKARRNAAPI